MLKLKIEFCPGLDYGEEYNCQSNKSLFAVHVDHDYVYVAEWWNNRVSVFHTSGAFITSFGRRGSGEGELEFSHGITTDQDGFLYVCDTENNRIQIF